MHWKNIGIQKSLTQDADSFVTDFGLRARSLFHKPLRNLAKLFVPKKIYIEKSEKIEKGKPYIFLVNHTFTDDIATSIAMMDRSAFILLGSTDLIKHNPKMYLAWLIGFIYVDRLNPESRKESLKKMERLLNSGTSIILFPEGGANHSENMIVNDFFASPYILAQKTGVEMVPYVMFSDVDSKEIHVRLEDPINFNEMIDKNRKEIEEDFDDLIEELITEEASGKINVAYNREYIREKMKTELVERKTIRKSLTELRDILATTMYELIEKYSIPIKREELGEMPRLDHNEQRRKYYLNGSRWTREVVDEEFTVYTPEYKINQFDVKKSLMNVKITKNNARIILKEQLEYESEEQLDLKKYLKENWNQPTDEKTYERIKKDFINKSR